VVTAFPLAAVANAVAHAVNTMLGVGLAITAAALLVMGAVGVVAAWTITTRIETRARLPGAQSMINPRDLRWGNSDAQNG
jgi:hypothetical protein